MSHSATRCLRCARTLQHASTRSFSTSRRALADHVRIIEVGPRDGLQNEKRSIPIETKIELVRRLAKTGLETIEAGSFVSPKWVPQMAASDKVLSSILTSAPPSSRPITWQWLLPNSKGLEHFLRVMEQAPPVSSAPDHSSAYPSPPPSPANDSGPAPNTSSQDPNAMPSATSGVDAMSQSQSQSQSPSSSPSPSLPSRHEVSIFLAATESFSQRNTNCSIAESLARFAPLITASRAAGHPVRAYISVALGCPFEGVDVPPQRVAELATHLLELGAGEVAVADTTGTGTAPRTRALLRALRDAGVRVDRDVALHLHDTFGQALVNALVALEHGVRAFDAAVGGLGGCPYSPGATGNVATEDLVYFLHSLGATTGVDLEGVSRIGEWITGEIGKGNSASAGKATMARLRREAEGKKR